MTRLESVVTPMAERVDHMYHWTGSLDQQLDEVHRLVENLAVASRDSHVPPVPARNPARSPTTEAANPLSQSIHTLSPPKSPPRDPKTKVARPKEECKKIQWGKRRNWFEIEYGVTTLFTIFVFAAAFWLI